MNKANKSYGIIRITFACLNKMFKSLFMALVRPHLEHVIQIWNPYLKKDIEVAQNVQRRAMKLVLQLKNLPYEETMRTKPPVTAIQKIPL